MRLFGQLYTLQQITNNLRKRHVHVHWYYSTQIEKLFGQNRIIFFSVSQFFWAAIGQFALMLLFQQPYFPFVLQITWNSFLIESNLHMYIQLRSKILVKDYYIYSEIEKNFEWIIF